MQTGNQPMVCEFEMRVVNTGNSYTVQYHQGGGLYFEGPCSETLEQAITLGVDEFLENRLDFVLAWTEE